MSTNVIAGNDGIVTVTISGMFTVSDFRALRNPASQQGDAVPGACLLIRAEAFQGFARGGWDDPALQLEAYHPFDRIALVSDQKWKTQIEMFLGKGFREAAVEHFPPNDLARAVAWLKQG